MMQVGDQRQLWGEQYDRPLADLLAVQRDMSREISEQLRRRLTPEARARVARSHTENVEAYQLYLKGRHYWFKYPRPEYDKSREYLQQAIDLDPNYALAWAGLADYYGFAAAHGRFRPDEAWPKAEAATRKALALDPSLAEAYLGSAGQKMVLYRDWEGAEKEIQRAIELNPGFAELNRLHGTLLTMMGRFEESHVVHRRLLEQEPLSAAYRLSVAHLFYMERRYDEAIAECRKALELDPDDPWVYQLMGNALEYAGRPAEAVAAWRQNLLLSGEPGLAARLERTFADSGFDAAVHALSQAELERYETLAARGEHVPAMFFARLHTQLGNREAAFEWLAKAEKEPNRWILEAAVAPAFDPLRGDPRFNGLLERLGLAGRPRPA
jgi:tetratricopeptide (TPR) repeat protein